MIDLSICIVNWNVKEKLKLCLDSIMRFKEGLSLEIIIVDNASSDGSADMVKKDFPGVILIQNHENIGFGRANNQAIAITKGLYILLLNPDIIITKPSFKDMITFINNKKNAGVVGCRLMNQDGSVQESYYMKFPTPLSELSQGLLLHRIFPKRKQFNQVIKVAWIVGAVMLFHSDELKAIGGFDDRYFIYAEDIDICYTLNRRGCHVWFLGTIEMLHFHAASSKKQSKGYFTAIMQRESVAQFMKKNYGIWAFIGMRIAWFLSCIIRIPLLVLIISFAVLFKRKKIKSYVDILIRYYKILSWSLGLESWVKK